MIAGSVASLAGVSALLDADQRAAAWAGMAAPVLAATATSILVERTSARAPVRVTTVLLHGFAVKIIFFLAYVALALRVLALEAMPFIVSFTIYFVASYGAVAVWLQRRFVASLHQAR
jgi:hypothetical protein